MAYKSVRCKACGHIDKMHRKEIGCIAVGCDCPRSHKEVQSTGTPVIRPRRTVQVTFRGEESQWKA